MIDPEFLGHFHGLVGTSIVDNEYLDAVHPLYGPGNIPNGHGQCLFFVETGNLDDHFHGVTGRDRLRFRWLNQTISMPLIDKEKENQFKITS
jgi:hypothetical protein